MQGREMETMMRLIIEWQFTAHCSLLIVHCSLLTVFSRDILIIDIMLITVKAIGVKIFSLNRIEEILEITMIIKMQRKLTRRHGDTARIILENTFSDSSQVARILKQLTFIEMEEKFAVPLCRRVRLLSRYLTHLSILATSANIPNTFPAINIKIK